MAEKEIQVAFRGRRPTMAIVGGVGVQYDKLADATPFNFGRASVTSRVNAQLYKKGHEEKLALADMQMFALVALGIIQDLFSVAQGGPDLQPDKSWCLDDIEDAKKRLSSAAVIAHQKVAARREAAKIAVTAPLETFAGSPLVYTDIATELIEVADHCVNNAAVAVNRYAEKCRQTSDLLQRVQELKEHYERQIRDLQLERDPLADFPDLLEYDTKFFADRHGMTQANVNQHLAALQKRHGSSVFRKDGTRWRIYDKALAMKIDDHLRRNRRQRRSSKPKTSRT